AVHTPKVALAIHQPIAQGEVLGHPHDGVVHRRITVGVILTDDVPDHTGGLLVGLVPIVREHVHREQHAPVYGLESIPYVGQRPADNDAHRVGEIGLPHLAFERDGQYLLRCIRHNYQIPECRKNSAFSFLKRSAENPPESSPAKERNVTTKQYLPDTQKRSWRRRAIWLFIRYNSSPFRPTRPVGKHTMTEQIHATQPA